jgi:N-methylhydantoinase A
MLGVDVGGTFTDVVGVKDGRIEVTKVPSNVARPELAVIKGVEILGGEGRGTFNHASTVGLNSIITRRLPKLAFLTTEGHRDILDFGRCWRPLEGQTDPHWRRSFGDASRPLVERYLRRGIRERKDAQGQTLLPLDEDQARSEIEVLKRCEVDGVAICLLNSYVDPEHEQRLRELVREVLGDVPCSISSDVSPLAKEYSRASTTVVDAFMKLIFTDYAGNLVEGLRGAGFDGVVNFADSAATLMSWDFALENPYRLVFSGPSAGTASCVLLGEQIDDRNLICADVGGTSVDISVVTEGQPFVNTDFELEHDLLINTLSTEVVSLGAGGGSIIDINSAGELTVGPGSAGADPGPACYGKGGERPTVTDACLLIGILDDKGLLGGEMPLSKELAQQAFERLPSQIGYEELVGNSFRMALNNVAEGVIDIAIRHGLDPRDYSLVAYGAAGPMLLPALMDLVQVRRVIVPPHPGLFSALGLLSSDLVYTDSRSSYVTLSEDAAPEIENVFRSMEDSLLEKIGIPRTEVEIVRTLDAALVGQTWDTPFVPVPEGEITADSIPVLIENFHDHYQRRYGNQFRDIPVRGITYRVQVRSELDKVTYPQLEKAGDPRPDPIGSVDLRCLFDEPVTAQIYQREALLAGHRIEGPAVVREELSTTYVTPDQVATVGANGEILIERA